MGSHIVRRSLVVERCGSAGRFTPVDLFRGVTPAALGYCIGGSQVAGL